MSKSTCRLIREAGADYLIALKANQPRLFAAAQHLCQTAHPRSTSIRTERTRGRRTTRTVRVFSVPTDSAPFRDWCDLQTVVSVRRSGTRGGRRFAEHQLYISSRSMHACDFAEVVRGHWQVENALHWVKDVVLREDDCTTRAGNAPKNLALLRSLAITLFRKNGYRSITRALRRFAHDIHALFKLIE